VLTYVIPSVPVALHLSSPEWQTTSTFTVR